MELIQELNSKLMIRRPRCVSCKLQHQDEASRWLGSMSNCMQEDRWESSLVHIKFIAIELITGVITTPILSGTNELRSRAKDLSQGFVGCSMQLLIRGIKFEAMALGDQEAKKAWYHGI